MQRSQPAHVAAIHKRQQEQMMEEAAENTAVAAFRAAQDMEKKLDAELTAYEALGESDLLAIRARRIEEMKKRQDMMIQWKRQGHGRYEEIGDQTDWFNESKGNERMICHFYRKTTWRCEIIDKHLEQIAPKHMETRIIKIDAEKCPFLCEKLSIVLMPTIIMTKDNATHDRIEGFDQLEGGDNCLTETLRRRLAVNGIIDYEGDLEDRMTEARKKSQKQYGNTSNAQGKHVYGAQHKVYDSDSD